jgi:hypothetical protein
MGRRKTKTYLMLTGLCIVLFCFKGRHDFHTSLTEVRLNDKSGSFEVTVGVFSDDFELALQKFSDKEDLKITDAESNAVIRNYFRKHLAFVKDKHVVFGEYLGKEIETDVTWIYIEVSEAKKLKGFNLLNTIFLEVFDDQTNVVNFIDGENRQTLLFNKKDKLKANPL